MQWSKSYLPKEVAEHKVMEFTPLKIELGTPQSAVDYLQRKAHGSDFRMSGAVEVQTGVDKIEMRNAEDKIEKLVIERLAEVQTQAYEEAYRLGIDEGRQKAFGEFSQLIEQKTNEFEQLLRTIEGAKTEILASNETHLVKLVLELASRLAVKTVEAHHEVIVDVIRQAVDVAQQEENVSVQVNPEHIEFLEELRKQTGRSVEFLKRLKLEPNDQIKVGGCIVQTNYGEIDARIETRLEKLADVFKEVMPKSKDRITG